MKKILFHTILALFAFLSFSGCTPKTHVPIKTRYYHTGGEERGRHLFVLLPGRGDAETSFEEQGMIGAVRERKLPFDLVAVDAHEGYYRKRILWERLREDVIAPAKAQGYSRIWLVGISMGGTGSLIYTMEYADDISGLVLLAPFLGDEGLISEIYWAGIEKWEPAQLTKNDWQERLWLWLKNNCCHGRDPVVYLGYGNHDQFAPANGLLASILPAEQVVLIPGGHNWRTWRALWDIILDRITDEMNVSK